jgi:DNA-binding response OmpR family regulator
LRQKVERDPAEPKLIKTMPNAGYQLDTGAPARELDDDRSG